MTPSWKLTRRDVLRCSAAAATLTASSCSASQAPMQFTPEEFGAAGNGVIDDYDAFQRMAAAINRSGGGLLALRPGARYFLDRAVTATNGITDVQFQGCSLLEIRGNNASISVKGDIHRDVPTTRGLAGLRFEDCAEVQVRNLQLIGNVQLMTRQPNITEATTHGLVFGGCNDVRVENVLVRHFATDGIYVRASTHADAAGRHRTSRRFAVRNSKFLFNARQGLSVIQLRDATFEDCDFSHTGYIAAPAVSGPYGVHAPGAGVDVEPNYTPFTPYAVDVLTGNLAFRRCRMVGNLGATISAVMYSGDRAAIENVSFEDCTLETSDASKSRYGFMFDVPGGKVTGCTLTMHDKTAYLGWYPQSDASPIFSGNTVSGDHRPSGRPLLSIRLTRGAPVVENNRLMLGEGGSPTALLQIANPRAIVRNNPVLTS